mgnify:CR=1 FL=1
MAVAAVKFALVRIAHAATEPAKTAPVAAAEIVWHTLKTPGRCSQQPVFLLPFQVQQAILPKAIQHFSPS